MALTGLQIFKHLPGGKKEATANCKKCGFPTCMAYAMKLAKGAAPIEGCEYISDELKALLEEASQVAQVAIQFDSASNIKVIGGETVMFRHDKTFVNSAKIAVKLNASDVDFYKKLEEIKSYSIERIAQRFEIDAVVLVDDASDSFVTKAKELCDAGIALILKTSCFEKLQRAILETKQCNPVIQFTGNESEALELIKNSNLPAIVTGKNLDDLVEKSQLFLSNGIKKIILNIENDEISETEKIKMLTYIRRAAIEKKFKPLGFPVINYLKTSENPYFDAVNASISLCKYSNLLVFDKLDKSFISTLFTLNQNIYTDPQKPLQVEPKLYEIADPKEDSVVFVTTNFALTYFAVVNELEGANIPSYVIITPSDGMSVLTAWSASKFTGEIIAKAVKNSNIEQKIKHRNLIIPGAVSSMVDEIKDELPEWNIIAGTNEAIDIPDFVHSL